jgi:hypothetical protein
MCCRGLLAILALATATACSKGAADEASAAAAPSAVATPAGSASVMASDAPTLRALGGTFLCEQRVYPPPPSPHLTAWGWAFAEDPDSLASKLEGRLAGATREGRTFRFLGADGKPQAVVDVREAKAGERVLDCDAPPPGTRSYVVASRM